MRSLALDVAKAGGRLYLVGGAVRDQIQGRQSLEADMELFHLSPAEAERILRRHGDLDFVGRQFGVFKFRHFPIDISLPRKEVAVGQKHTDFEISIEPDLPLETAAARRDFTINAIYFDWATGVWLDPLGGRKDLEKRILRHCSPKFSEDPLRVLRGAQLAARFSLEGAAETLSLCRNLNPSGISVERVFAEWEKWLLKGQSMRQGFEFLKASDWLRYYPQLEALVGCPQDPQWHPEGDVWEHTLHAMDAFAADREGNREEDLIVGFATLCHDFGKPLCTIEENGHIRSPGHEILGMHPAGQFLQLVGVPLKWIEPILTLVKVHMRPHQLYAQGSSDKAVRKLAAECGRIDRLLRLAGYDAAARPPLPDDSMEGRDWLKKRSEALQIAKTRPEAILMGRHLIEMGLSPSPHFKVLLREAYEAQLNGEFATPQEAVEWIQANFPMAPQGVDTEIHPEES